MDKVPYMQRGGAWDNSDLTKKGAAKMAARKEVVVNNNTTSKKITKKAWSDTDKAYANVRICGALCSTFSVSHGSNAFQPVMCNAPLG